MKLTSKLLMLMILSTAYLLSSIALPQSFTSSFSQKITNPKGKVIRYSGKVYFSNHKLFKWKYTRPTKKEVCSNGKEILIVDHDLEQVSAYFIKKGIDISNILKRARLYSTNIYVARYEKTKYTIRLNQNQLQSIAYYDELDNKVQIVFKNMRYRNGNISSKTMQCIYPRSYDFIDG